MATITQQQQQQQHSIGLPHGLGLLTTVASLPPKYRSRYLNIKTKCEIPLDLSVKQISPQIANDVPIATTFTEVYTEPGSEPESPTSEKSQIHAASLVQENYSATTTEQTKVHQPQQQQQQLRLLHPHQQQSAIVTITKISKANKPITPPLTPTVKRKYAEHLADVASTDTLEIATAAIDNAAIVVEQIVDAFSSKPAKLPKSDNVKQNSIPAVSTAVEVAAVNVAKSKRECTPTKPIRTGDTAPKTVKSQPPSAKLAKNKATRKLKFDEETSSPVSGTIIRPLEDITDGSMQYSNGDIDPKYNIVEITEETKAELAAIKNVIGDYICKLCRLKFDDAFGLAQHRCACIVLLEYRCPECGKQFNCPANLASHRRWHKPKKEGAGNSGGASSTTAARKENRNTMNHAAIARHTNAQNNVKKTEELAFACNECGKVFKRQAYLRKHLLTHANAKKSSGGAALIESCSEQMMAEEQHHDEGISTSTTIAVGSGSYKSYAGSSSASSMHSYSGTQEDEGSYRNVTRTNISGYDYVDDAADMLSDCSSNSSNSAGYGRLQIVESGLTEEENIAAAALTNLRNCASVIQHTTLAH